MFQLLGNVANFSITGNEAVLEEVVAGSKTKYLSVKHKHPANLQPPLFTLRLVQFFLFEKDLCVSKEFGIALNKKVLREAAKTSQVIIFNLGKHTSTFMFIEIIYSYFSFLPNKKRIFFQVYTTESAVQSTTSKLFIKYQTF